MLWSLGHSPNEVAVFFSIFLYSHSSYIEREKLHTFRRGQCSPVCHFIVLVIFVWALNLGRVYLMEKGEPELVWDEKGC